PGTATTGYGVVAFRAGALTYITHGTILTLANTPLPSRLLQIYAGIQGLIASHLPDVVALEELYFSRNTTTAFAVGQARGVVMLAAAQAGLAVCEYGPHQVKQAVTGEGRAAKQQVGYMVRLLLGLKEIPTPDDAADALAIAICHAHTHSGQARRAALGQDASGGRRR